MAAAAQTQNFDALYNGNRAFIIGGTTFHYRLIHWRDWGETLDARQVEVDEESKRFEEKVAALIAEGKTRVEAEAEADDETLIDSFQRVIDRILLYLEPNEHEAFKAVIEDRTKVITIAQLQELMVWLQGVQTPDRPTTTPTPSSPGPGTPGAISPAA